MTANSYFTYVSGMDSDGNQYAHRTGVQAWMVKEMTIYVQGPLPDGQYSAFAKKHLMTTTGGSFNESPEGKLTAISSKRRNDTIGFTNQERQDKFAAMQQFAPNNAEQYVGAGAYGANGIGVGTPLTMIHCDAIRPLALKTVFYDAIGVLKKTRGAHGWQGQVSNINGTTNDVGHVNIKFKDDIIYNQLYSQNKITTTNKMAVMVMKGKEINTFHVFHGAPYDATFPNA